MEEEKARGEQESLLNHPPTEKEIEKPVKKERRKIRILCLWLIVFVVIIIVSFSVIYIIFYFKTTLQIPENLKECELQVREKFQNNFQTMVSTGRREATLYLAVKTLESGVVGDFIETGVAGGGMTILMESLLVCTNSDKHHFMADAWEGLPPPKDGTKSQFSGGEFHVSYEALEANMEKKENLYADLDWKFNKGAWKNYVLKGWFADTLPKLSVGQRFSFLRLDGDCYDCTYDAIFHLYPRLNCGGYIYVDDFWEFPECRRAIRNYMKKFNQNFQSWAIVEQSNYTPQKSKLFLKLNSGVHVFNLTEAEGMKIKNDRRLEAAWWKKKC